LLQPVGDLLKTGAGAFCSGMHHANIRSIAARIRALYQ
jgi:hypothetical protein